MDIPGKGKGVVAAKNFHKGDFICEYVGELLPYQEAKEREEKYLKKSKRSYKGYMFFFEYKNKISAELRPELCRYPNITPQLVEIDDMPHTCKKECKTRH